MRESWRSCKALVRILSECTAPAHEWAEAVPVGSLNQSLTRRRKASPTRRRRKPPPLMLTFTMHKTRTSLGRRVCRSMNFAAAFCAFIVSCLPLVSSIAQVGPPGYTSDNSDWLPYTSSPECDDEAISQKREPAASNFHILGLNLDDETFGKATAKLGKTTVVERGDASTGRSQICYTSPGKRSKTYLIFEKGEVNDAFYLFNIGPDWKGSELCTESNLVTTSLSTASGLHLGQTTAEVRAILGKPSVITGSRVIYSFAIEKKTAAADLSPQNENVRFVQSRNVRFHGWPRAPWKRSASP